MHNQSRGEFRIQRSGVALRTVFGALLAAGFGGLLAQQAPAPAAEVKTAEQVYKNITALKGTPADQLMPAMQFISASLGVECNFCHVQGKMDADDKRSKRTAREMIAMTMAINKDHFGGQREMTCYSCHHGAAHPMGAPPVLETDAPRRPEMEPPPARAMGQSADSILEKYVAALGGADAIRKVTSRVEKGAVRFGGQETAIEVIEKAPNKRISIMHMPNGDSITAFDGTSGWLGNAGRPPREMPAAESDAAGLDADLYFAVRLKEIFKQLRPSRPEKIGDVQCQTINAMRPGQPPVRLYFDETSGLLVRMVRYIETPVGRYPTEIDYADYREVDGVKVPTRWTLARPNGRFTIAIADVQQNVPVDDARFVKPAAGAN
jgi:photosynthetic reaction center cytochrome c subunit